MDFQIKPFQFIESSNPVLNLYVFDVNSAPGAGDDYYKFMERLSTVPHGTRVNFYIDSIGGVITVPYTLEHTLNLYRDKLTVNTYIITEAFSAAGLIFLLGDKRIVNPNSVFMMHQTAYGIDKNIIVANTIQDKYRDIYRKEIEDIKKWLTAEEIERYNKGENIYIYPEEMLKRGIATDFLYNGKLYNYKEFLKAKKDILKNVNIIGMEKK